MNVKYRVTLETSERAELVAMVVGGKGAFRRLKRAPILLAADHGASDEEIARNVAVGVPHGFDEATNATCGNDRGEGRGANDASRRRPSLYRRAAFVLSAVAVERLAFDS